MEKGGKKRVFRTTKLYNKAKEQKKIIVFSEYEAEKFLAKYLPIAKSKLLKLKEVKKILDKKKLDEKITTIFSFSFNFPLVVKIISNDLVHKSDSGGVKIAYNEEQLFNFLKDLLKKAYKFKACGILFQEFMQGQEVIIGLKKDPTFGHILALGIGGIYVEILKDVVFRACPIDEKEAQRMLDELKFKKIFSARGRKTNLDLLKKVLVKTSRIAQRNPDILELDINPFIINDKEGKIVDARIVFEK